MRMIQLGRLKAGLRRFLTESASAEATLSWNASESHLDINCSGRGIDMTFPPGSMNEDGDILTDEEKQAIIDALQVIVDEHNSQI